MNTSHRTALVVALVALPSLAAAQGTDPAIRTVVICAPQTTSSSNSDAPRIIGIQDSSNKALYGTRDMLIINAGTSKGTQLGQRFAIRRVVATGNAPYPSYKAVATAGLLTIVAVNESTAIGSVDFACNGIDRGDYLEAWTEPQIPADVARTDAGGELDFTAPARVLFGDYEHTAVAAGDLVIADAGQDRGVAPGTRFAVYRDVKAEGVPLAAVGEGVVISVSSQTSLIRITRTKDAVQSGDLLIPRKR